MQRGRAQGVPQNTPLAPQLSIRPISARGGVLNSARFQSSALFVLEMAGARPQNKRPSRRHGPPCKTPCYPPRSPSRCTPEASRVGTECDGPCRVGLEQDNEKRNRNDEKRQKNKQQ